MKLLSLARFTFFCLLAIPAKLFAQTDSIWKQSPDLTISAFADVFYVYDFNQPQGNFRQPFLYNHNRHNEFNLNMGYLKFGLTHTKYRANLALQAGTYVNDNYAAEPGVLKSLFEANIGLSLNKQNSLWIDAGIIPSHIGFESAVSMDNWTLTRSLLAENSPYFLSGAKLSYAPNANVKVSGLLLNGWQRIQRLPGNSLPSFGTQVIFVPSEKATINWSTFIGTDDPDSIRRMRYFNNLYGQFQLTEKLGIIAGFDLGAQQKVKGSKDYAFWLSPVFIAKYHINNSWKTALRVEYYQDNTGIIIPTGTLNGFQTTGFSTNIDYLPTKHIACRLEARLLRSTDKIFETMSSPSTNNFIIGSSMAFKF
jgi:hypothetical protein